MYRPAGRHHEDEEKEEETCTDGGGGGSWWCCMEDVVTAIVNYCLGIFMMNINATPASKTNIDHITATTAAIFKSSTTTADPYVDDNNYQAAPDHHDTVHACADPNLNSDPTPANPSPPEQGGESSMLMPEGVAVRRRPISAGHGGQSD